MKEYTKIATLAGECELISEGSWGERDLGKHAWTMELFDTVGDAGHGFIEWYIPSLDEVEIIGLSYEMRDGKRALTEYDGVFSLPHEAIEFLRSNGIIVDEEFE